MKRDMNNEKGFTLIEVMIAVFLLAIGMLSAASMQTTAISGNKFSKDMSIAIELVEEMVDRIRVNSGNSPQYYNGIDTSATCSGADPVLGDCKQWQMRMKDENLGLMKAVGKVTVSPANPWPDWSNGVPIPRTATVTVRVEWTSGGGSSWMRKARSIEVVTIIETWVS
ncbi:MAG: type IV pilus modification protein PilV [bacterium]|nr:type IV pilus modification protein PilV [bacterium]